MTTATASAKSARGCVNVDRSFGQTRYVARIYVDGRRIHIAYCPTHEQAGAELRAAMQRLEDGLDPKRPGTKHRRPTPDPGQPGGPRAWAKRLPSDYLKNDPATDESLDAPRLDILATRFPKAGSILTWNDVMDALGFALHDARVWYARLVHVRQMSPIRRIGDPEEGRACGKGWSERVHRCGGRGGVSS